MTVLAGRRLPWRKRWACALVVALGVSGCAIRPPTQHGAPARDVAADTTLVADTAAAPMAANAVVNQGRGGYQRTTVPPGFMVLMIGVPVLLLLL